MISRRRGTVDALCERLFTYTACREPSRKHLAAVRFEVPDEVAPFHPWVDMGADALVASGRADAGAAAELKAEARRRLARGEHFGHIPYLSLVARKSA